MKYRLLSLREYLQTTDANHPCHSLPSLLPQIEGERRSFDFWNRISEACSPSPTSDNQLQAACQDVLRSESTRMNLQEFVDVEFGTDSPQAATLENWRQSTFSDQRTRHVIDCLWIESRVQRECWREICKPFFEHTPGDWHQLQSILVQEIFPAHISHALHGPPADFSPDDANDVLLGLVDHNLSMFKRIYPAGDAGGGSDPVRYLRSIQHNPSIPIRWNTNPSPLTRMVLFFLFNEGDPKVPPFEQFPNAQNGLARELADRLALFPEWDTGSAVASPMVLFQVKTPISPTIPTILEGFAGKVGRFRPSNRNDRFGRTYPIDGVSPLPEVVHSSEVFSSFSKLMCGIPQLIEPHLKT